MRKFFYMNDIDDHIINLKMPVEDKNMLCA